MSARGKAMRVRGAIAVAISLFVCLPVSVAEARQRSVSRPHQAARAARQEKNSPGNAGIRVQGQAARQGSAPAVRATPFPTGNAQRPVMPSGPAQGAFSNSVPRAQVYAGAGTNTAQSSARPAYRSFPPGHLGSWLEQHKGLPVQQQEQMLRTDPNFRQLAPAAQQRLMQQLQQVNQLPEAQRERRLQRAETIEHLSQQERTEVSQASRNFATLPADRKTLVRRAFQDLRSVPLDQRQTVLNSARYQGVFTPDERNILSGFLLAEPYAPRQ